MAVFFWHRLFEGRSERNIAVVLLTFRSHKFEFQENGALQPFALLVEVLYEGVWVDLK